MRVLFFGLLLSLVLVPLVVAQSRKLLSIAEESLWLPGDRGACLENQAQNPFTFKNGGACSLDAHNICGSYLRGSCECKYPCAFPCLLDNFGELSAPCAKAIPCSQEIQKFCPLTEQRSNAVLPCLKTQSQVLSGLCTAHTPCLNTSLECPQISYSDKETGSLVKISFEPKEKVYSSNGAVASDGKKSTKSAGSGDEKKGNEKHEAEQVTKKRKEVSQRRKEVSKKHKEVLRMEAKLQQAKTQLLEAEAELQKLGDAKGGVDLVVKDVGKKTSGGMGRAHWYEWVVCVLVVLLLM